MIEIYQLPARKDNFAYILREPSGLTAAVDTPELAPIRRFLDERKWTLDFIFNTHHHGDHVGANLELVKIYGAKVYGCGKDAARIPGLNVSLQDGQEFFFGQEKVKVIACDGHTIGHISFWFPNSRALFVGDTIFSLGCGALFEGSAREMWNSLERLRALPEDTLVYCAHEYTLENAAYAITAEPENSRLKARVEEAKRQIASGCFTVPSSLASEKACNPFLRPESSEIQRKVKMEGKPLWEVFAAIRKDKDLFDSNS